MDDAKSDDVLVSVIVPVYNVAKYLGRCLDSLLAQTHGNCEFIVIDDGSTDESARICDHYAAQDGRVRVVHKQNGGLSSARNAGLDIARGSYYAFVDSDDYVESKYVENMLRAILESEAELAMCSVVCEDGEGHPVALPFFVALDDCVHRRYDCMAMSCDNTAMIVAWNKLYRANLWSSLRFPEGEIHEDELVFHHVLKQCKSVAFVSDGLYHYVSNDKSIMHADYSSRNLSRITALSERIAVLRDLGYDDLVSTVTDMLIDAYLVQVIRMNYRDASTRRELSSLGKRISRDLGGASSLLTLKQRMNLQGISRCPVLYLDLRRCLNKLRKQ
ncbi:glycosyltransferase family 2 protein [Bifidobacterium pullorum subsp. saeculare]|uniref:Glycosyltransferase family 2 protein n=1 Tax=Bifidobacterium pullorum subsp. saeculare TaxID=78257 RepID=A0A938WXX1_9BIFI|nr:glycosyltransferase family 2 protein [Bifidobacterium pullorum]MBM6699643.1 glycosyltransferase family 2 protein [Bifidobacterium pullorum subsp. saeculare]